MSKRDRLIDMLALLGVAAALDKPTDDPLEGVCQRLGAAYAAVYCGRQDTYQLVRDYAVSPALGWKPDIDKLRIVEQPQFVDECDKLKALFPSADCRGCLYLPLKWEKELGFLLATWGGDTPHEEMTYADEPLLPPVMRLLADIYVAPLALAALREDERQSTELYLETKRELNEYKNCISVELHDELERLLLSVVLQLDLLQQADELDYIRGRMAGLRHIADQGLNEVRRIYSELNPSFMPHAGLVAALEVYLQEYKALTGIAVNFIGCDLPDTLSARKTALLYEAAHVALSHIQRHTVESEITVRIIVKDNAVFLQVTDNSRDAAEASAYGLSFAGLYKSVAAEGGRLWLSKLGGQWSSFNLLLPLG